MANYIDKIKKDGVEYEIRTQGPLPITAELAHSDIGDEESILPRESVSDLDEETYLLYLNELKKIATRGWIESSLTGEKKRYAIVQYYQETQSGDNSFVFCFGQVSNASYTYDRLWIKLDSSLMSFRIEYNK